MSLTLPSWLCLFLRSFLFLGLFIPFSTFSQFEDKDDLSFSSFDTLHIYPTKYLSNSGIPSANGGMYNGVVIQEDILKVYDLEKLYHGDRYTVPEKFIISENVIGYVLTCENHADLLSSYVVLIVLDEEGKLVYHQMMAWYSAIEGTMEETGNTWIFDNDGDGDLDLATMEDLVDYELPNEFANNVSGVKGYVHQFTEGEYVYEYITKELYQSLTIKK